MSKAIVAGVGMTRFYKPSASPNYDELGEQAVRDALADAGLEFADIEQAYAGYVHAASVAGQAVLSAFGATGIPVVNVHNNCGSGSTALFLARQLIVAGAADCVLAFGFEQMPPGPALEAFPNMKSPIERFSNRLAEFIDDSDAPPAIKVFGAAATELQHRYGVKDETFAKVVVKARRHAEHNERAIFRNPLTVDDVLDAPRLYGPITRFQACPPTCGGAAVILVSERFAARRGITSRIAIRGQVTASDVMPVEDATSPIELLGTPISKYAADKAYAEAGIGPEDLDLAEIHDCFAVNELLLNMALGFAKEGETEAFVQDGQNTYGGSIVVNPSGGLLSKGHPIGATGLAQIAELTWQLRGQAGVRQVEGARLGLAQNAGLGSACTVTVMERLP